jgi:CHAD domain-containing protein
MPIDAKRSREVFQKLDRDLIKLSSKPSAQSVHRFRTGTRRVQILLAELSPKLDGNEKKLLKQLNAIRKRAGKLRDLDVQLAALHSVKVPREPRRKTQLVHHLIELRSQQEKKLRKSADRATIREIRKRLKRAAKRFRPEKSRDPLATAKGMLNRSEASAELNEAVLHQYRILTKRAAKRFRPEKSRDPLATAKGMLNRSEASAELNEAVLHQYRILTKRARYAAEFAAPAAAATVFIAELKGIQDALGDWHDWLTLTHSAGDRIGDVHESPLVAEIHNVTGAKYRRAVAALTQMRARMAKASQPAAQISARTSEKSEKSVGNAVSAA